jgi:diketogulonate reductase-like aldo/keto reductase
LKDPVVTKISQAKNLSNAQVLLLWALQKGLSVVPKSTNPQHIAENINLDNSSLTDEEIELLDTIDLNKKYAWNADKVL